MSIRGGNIIDALILKVSQIEKYTAYADSINGENVKRARIYAHLTVLWQDLNCLSTTCRTRWWGDWKQSASQQNGLDDRNCVRLAHTPDVEMSE